MVDNPALHVNSATSTIVAVATPPGQGGVGIVRLSGPLAGKIAEHLVTDRLKPRIASYAKARDAGGHEIDQGIALYFPGPASFTGDDVFEFQGHGSPVVLQMIVDRCLALGAEMARPGEFSERAFLNGKLDLAQAEAIADLIESHTETAARAALRSLRGDFSKRVHQIVDELTALRVFVEAAIDFPEEEIDFLAENDVSGRTRAVLSTFDQLAQLAHRGTLLRDAVRVVLVGPPNAGKSSLLNALSGDDRAIVSDIPGTTRDVLEQTIQINGLPVVLTDTAGLREGADEIELEGIKRARKALKNAHLAMVCVEDSEVDSKALQSIINNDVSAGLPYAIVRNKADLSHHNISREENTLFVSAKYQQGIDLLCDWITEASGFSNRSEGQFLARQRHLDALSRARSHVESGWGVYDKSGAGELLAEELSLAQRALGEITGEFTNDDLLGEIFGSFCIGK